MRLTKPLIITLITALFSLIMFSNYLSGPLKGNIDWFFLPAAKFGIPQKLIDKGITPLYTDDLNVGWDGQFYYYIANDLRGSADTVKHIDADAYRYQRIGIPLLTNIISKVTFQSWVSPKTYFFSYFALILLACFFLALLLQNLNASPWLTLFWGLSFGVNLTLFNALPDAGAEAFCLLMLCSYIYKRWFFYSIFATMAALSREAYIIVPAILFLCHLIKDFDKNQVLYQLAQRKFKYFCLIFPGIIFLAWQSYIQIHFKTSPSSQAFGILSLPFQELAHYFSAYTNSLMSAKGFSLTTNAILQLCSLITYSFLILSFFFIAIKLLLKPQNVNFNALSITLAFIPMMLLNLCFGKTVMFDYTGYLKAINILFILNFLLLILAQKKISKLYLVAVIGLLFFGTLLLWNRVNAPPYIESAVSKTQSTQTFKCQPMQKLSLEKLDVAPSSIYKNDLFRKLWHKPKIIKQNIKITNHNNFIIGPSKNSQGTYHLSYQIVIKEHGEFKVLEDGYRTGLKTQIMPNTSLTQAMYIRLKHTHYPNNAILVISLVQEGCQWLWQENPNSAIFIKEINAYGK